MLILQIYFRVTEQLNYEFFFLVRMLNRMLRTMVFCLWRHLQKLQ